jgi:putative transposase
VFGVEPICRALTELGLPIAPSTYYEARGRPPSRRTVRDESLRVEVARVHRTNYSAYGARKVWLQLRREDIDVARCTVERLMGEMGLVGVRRGKKKRTTIADPQADRAGDLVNRKFDPVAPNVLWVADFTYVSTWSGWVYVAFVIDAYSRRIVGWRTATAMNTALVLDAIDHAIWTRQREGITDLTGLIHHNDRGSQGGFNRSSQHLDDGGVWWRVQGSLGLSDLRLRGGSGLRIGRCGRRCGRRVGLSRRALCSGTFGV